MKDRIYFPGLNGIRFLAALSVIFFHLADTALLPGSNDQFFLSKVVLNGGDAVTLFFVLSGFLITYLLLVESWKTGAVNVRKFYLRRILRIWPLYYLLVFLGLVIVPLLERLLGTPSGYSLNSLTPMQYLTKVGIYVLFIPHIGTYFGHTVNGIEQLWSIGVEEHFYLIWPLFIMFFPRRVLTVLLSIIAFKWLMNLVYTLFVMDTPSGVMQIVGLINYFRIENMAVGGLGAYMLFHKKQRLLDVIHHPLTEKIVLGLMIANIFLFTGEDHWLLNQLTSVIYLLFIMNVCSKPKPILKLENPVFNHLGRISYGLYMYHVFVIYVLVMILPHTSYVHNINFFSTLELYIVATALTIILAHFSYSQFEQRFLRIKQRFTVVKSGEPA